MSAKNDPTARFKSTEWVDDGQRQVPSAFASTSERVRLKPGVEVRVGNQRYRIRQILDLETILAHDPQSGETRRFKVSELAPLTTPVDTPLPIGQKDLAGISDEAWQIAQQRFSVIRPLLSTPRCTLAQVEACARTAHVNVVTVYRWLKRYQAAATSLRCCRLNAVAVGGKAA